MRTSHRRPLGAGLGLTLAIAGMVAAPAIAQARTVDGVECTVTGSEGPDVLRGTSGADVICGLGGNDVIYGRGGNDVIYAGAGNDVVYGGAGNDQILGGDGVDVLFGGKGDDGLDGGAGGDVLFGGLGDDLLVGGAGEDRLFGGAGADRLSPGASSESRMWELDVQQRYFAGLPQGTVIRWGAYQGNPTCLVRSASGWTYTLGSNIPDLRMLLEGSRDKSCAGKTVSGRWQVRVDTPTGKSATVAVSAELTLPASDRPYATATLGCSPIQGDVTCIGSTGKQVLAPLPVVTDIRVGPFG